MKREDKRLLKLAKFVKLLKEAKIHDFKIKSFESRLRLQKYVYIAKELFGMSLDYPFNLYLRGPYSPTLADDYYRLPTFEGDLSKVRYGKEKFEKFKEFVKDKTSTELEIIATTHFVWKSNKHLLNSGTYSKERLEELVIRKVLNLKGDLIVGFKRPSEDLVREILKEIQNI
ncbi:hypothetical protein [Archaeoglobus neptunius]|uniref:hypothetical protein n=1 Tax=Archaeoglobus neptunius TaxID=2798580 RepID=UPI0019264D28|nr:hypothetical protein [Archaeoglobus neptunius]